jgi:hypothetical protein
MLIFSFEAMHIDNDESEKLLLWMYKKFLIGSKVCEKVVVNTKDQLKTLVQVALNDPTSLQKLRQVQNGGCITDTLVFDNDNFEVDEDFLYMCLKVNLYYIIFTTTYNTCNF